MSKTTQSLILTNWFILSISVFICTIECTAQTSHSTPLNIIGCLSAQGSSELQTSALSSIRQWAYSQGQADMLDDYVGFTIQLILRNFEVKPSVAYYDDKNSPNAYAHPVSTHGSTDGSIRLGGNMIFSEFKLHQKKFIEECLRNGKDPYAEIRNSNGFTVVSIDAIIAHETAHILQMKMGHGYAYPSKGTELQADFLAGWFFAFTKRLFPKEFQKFNMEESGLYAFLSRGDYAFNSIHHHGTPAQRANAFSEGLNMGDLPLKRAWRKSLKYKRTVEQ